MTTQKGRSLLEMLAVLCIMAVISFSAFQGFEYVVRKNAVGNIWKEVLVRASALRSNSRSNTKMAGFSTQAHGAQWEVITDAPAGAACSLFAGKPWLAIKVSHSDIKIIQQLLQQARVEKPKSLKCVLNTSRLNYELLSHPTHTCSNCTNLIFVFQRGSR